MTSEYRFDQIAIVSTEKKKPADADKENYIGLEHLSSETFEVVDYGSEVAPKGEKLVMRKGDVLFGKRRAYQKKVGIAPCDGIFSAHGMVLRPNEEVIDALFFPFFIKSDAFLDEAIRISVGSLSPTVNWRDLRELKFNLPSLDRQHEVAELLWAGENLKTTYRRLQSACDEQVKSRFVEMFGDPASNPYGFRMAGLTELGSCKNGMNFHSSDSGVELPCLGVADFKNLSVIDGVEGLSTVSLNERPSDEYLLNDGDIVFVRSNGNKELVGRCLAVYTHGKEAVFSGFCIRLRLNNDDVRVPYLVWALKQPSLRSQMFGRGANVQNLNQKILSRVHVPVPSMALQDEFLSFVAQVDKSEFRCPSGRQPRGRQTAEQTRIRSFIR